MEFIAGVCMRFFNFLVGSCFVGNGRSYIYILYTRSEKRLYIGQTNERGGVIGRLVGHISSRGTFRARLNNEGIDLDKIDDLQVFAYCLPEDPRFTNIDRSYREGVEHLVQKRLHSLRGDLNPPMRIVSYVEYNSTSDLPQVRSVANEVIDAFMTSFASLSA